MSSITINIKEEHLDELRRKAQNSKLSIEQLVEKYIHQILETEERNELMEKAAEYVLNKNDELLKRLA